MNLIEPKRMRSRALARHGRLSAVCHKGETEFRRSWMTNLPQTTCDQTDDLIRLLTQQRDLYQRLDELGKGQAGFIAQGATEQLLEVLSSRQGVIEQLQDVSRQLGPYREYLSDLPADIPQKQRQALRSLVDDVQSLLHGIIERDDQDRRKLAEARKTLGQSLQQVTHTSAAVSAYRKPKPKISNPDQARFTDSVG